MIETLLAADPLYRVIIILLGSIAMVLLASLSVGALIAAGGSAGDIEGDDDQRSGDPPRMTAMPSYDLDGHLCEMLTTTPGGATDVYIRRRSVHPSI